MSYRTPDNLLYTEEHEWIDTDTGWVGITDFAQDELGDIVFVDLPEVGRPVDADDPFMVIESVKAVSDVYSPATGEVAEVNESLEDQPERVNDSPYDEGQIVRLSVSELPDSLLSPEEYESYIG